MSGTLADVVASARRALELEWAAEEQRELELTEQEKWARDPVGWINAHVWIASPFGPDVTIPTTVEGWARFRRRVRPVRMRLFPAQRRTIDAWIDVAHLEKTGELVFRNLVDEKSRQIGETWVFAAIICWALLYHRVTGLAMHVDAGEIDDGGARNTVKSIFGKVRYIHQRLDRAQLLGLGTLTFRPFSRELAKVENPLTGAVWYGEGQSDDPGRGGTFDAVLVDEAAFVRHGEKVHAAIDDACPNGKAYNSTVNGNGNFHARIADEKPAGWTYERLHWSEHPIYQQGLHVAGLPVKQQPTPEMAAVAKACELCAGSLNGARWSPSEPVAHRYPGKLTSPWYDQRVIGKTDEQVANELDIDRERALGGRVYSEFATPVHVIDEGIPYEYEIPIELAWDFGLDTTSVIVLQNAPMEVRAIGILELGDQHGTTATPERVAEQLRLYLQELGVTELETTPFYTAKLRAIGDPAGAARTLDTGRPIVAAYRRQGFVIGKPPKRLTRTVDPSITSVKQLLNGTPKPLRICGVNAAAFADHLRNNTWPTDANGQRQVGSTTPRDDVHNHACRAFAYWTVATFPPALDDPNGGPTADAEHEGPVEERLARRRRRATSGHLHDLDDTVSLAMRL